MSEVEQVQESEPARHLPWDSKHFGWKIAAVTARADGTPDLSGAVNWSRAQGIDCLYALLDADQPDALRQAQEAGFVFIDGRITLARAQGPRAGDAGADRDAGAGASDGLHDEAEREQARQIVAGAFAQSRFTRDRRFAPERTAAMYEIWLDNDLRDAHLLVERDPAHGVVGLLSYAFRDESAEISLLAISPAVRGSGLGRRLLRRLDKALAEADCQHVSVVTQSSNIAAIRLYEAAGFRTVRLQYWFHQWLTP